MRSPKRIWFERVMILLLFIIQLLVVFVGVISYRKMNEVIAFARVPETTSEGLLLQRSVLVSLNDAERNAKSYYLTRKGNYLSGYYRAAYRLASLIDRMDSVSWPDDRQRILSDSLILYYEQELSVLRELIYLENNEQVTDELAAISKTADRLRFDTAYYSSATDTKNQQPDKTKKQGFFNRVFGNRSADTLATQARIGDTRAVVLKSASSDIRKQVSRVKDIQTDKLKSIKAREFALTDESIGLYARIQSTVNQMEELERSRIRNSNERAIQLADKTKELTLLFGLLIIIMLLISSVVIIAYFITNKKQRRQLRLESENARQQAKARENLVANMSHEIRTPLNSVIGFLEQVLQSRLTDEQHDQLSVARRSADHLLRVINDMLDNSRLEAGKLKLNIAVFSPAERLKDILRVIEIQSKEKKLELVSDISPDIPRFVKGDPVRFAQVTINILANAVKYTGKGFVRLEAKTEGRTIRMVVSDTGSGIPADKLSTIFNRFEQVSEKQAGSGAGLGLSIARQLIMLQGGKIEIESEINKGTRVTIIWPFEETDPQPEAVPVPEQDISALLNGKKILIADDEKFNRQLLMTILRKQGIHADEAESGLQVLQLVAENNYDLIIMDVRMPEMNGIEATEKIRSLADPAKSKVPVIALTAGLESEKIQKCRAAGMNEFLSKPYREQDLLVKIKNVLNH